MTKLIVLSGIPGTGKTSFASFLRDKHGFGHVDVDWLAESDPTLFAILQRSRGDFARVVAERHPGGVVIDWGFPPEARHAVEEFRRVGAEIVWFAGDYQRARANFLRRGTVPESAFDTQLRKIKAAGLPRTYPELRVVQALGPNGEFRSHEDLRLEILGALRSG